MGGVWSGEEMSLPCQTGPTGLEVQEVEARAAQKMAGGKSVL